MFTLGQTQKPAFERIHVKIKFICKTVGSAACPSILLLELHLLNFYNKGGKLP